MARYDTQGRRLCTATTRAGNPCRAPAIKAATVCNKHGGQLPNVKEKAHRVRMSELVDPALLEARDMLTAPGTPPQVKASLIRIILEWSLPKPAIRVEGMPSLDQVATWLKEAESDAS